MANGVSPRDFPVLMTVQQWNRTYGGRRGCVACSVCRLALDPRLANRHAKACMRRKRQDPAMWAEWVTDMRRSS